MIKTFEQFSKNYKTNYVRPEIDEMDKPFITFFEKIQNRVDSLKDEIMERVNNVKTISETIMEEYYGEFIEKTPDVFVDDDFFGITVYIYTNLPEQNKDEIKNEIKNYFKEFDNIEINCYFDIDNEGCKIEIRSRVYDKSVQYYINKMRDFSEQ
jgi:F0F1-type ATP synthase delta subunit